MLVREDGGVCGRTEIGGGMERRHGTGQSRRWRNERRKSCEGRGRRRADIEDRGGEGIPEAIRCTKLLPILRLLAALGSGTGDVQMSPTSHRGFFRAEVSIAHGGYFSKPTMASNLSLLPSHVCKNLRATVAPWSVGYPYPHPV